VGVKATQYSLGDGRALDSSTRPSRYLLLGWSHRQSRAAGRAEPQAKRSRRQSGAAGRAEPQAERSRRQQQATKVHPTAGRRVPSPEAAALALLKGSMGSLVGSGALRACASYAF
jgi:hypothetical protein